MDKYYAVPMLAGTDADGHYCDVKSTREFGNFAIGSNYAYDGLRGVTIPIEIPYWMILAGAGAAAWYAWKRGWILK